MLGAGGISMCQWIERMRRRRMKRRMMRKRMRRMRRIRRRRRRKKMKGMDHESLDTHWTIGARINPRVPTARKQCQSYNPWKNKPRRSPWCQPSFT